MGKGGRGVEVFVVLAGIMATAFFGIAIYEASQTNGEGGIWFLWGGFTLAAAILVTFVYFVLHPAFVALDRRRVKIVGPKAAKKERARWWQRSAAKPTGRVPTIEIISANYGDDDAVHKDVTDLLRQQQAADGSFDVLVSNAIFGPDPIENVIKRLWVSYTLDGLDTTTTVGEGSRLVLP